MDLYEVDMQVSRAHRTPKSVYDNKCRPIFLQFVNCNGNQRYQQKINCASCKEKVKSDSLEDVLKEPHKSQESSSIEKKRNNKRIARSIRVFGFSSQIDG